jgi:hypothetical protein
MRPSAGKRVLALVLGPALLIAMAGAQPQGQPEDRPPPKERAEQGQDLPSDPAQAKKFLERRLEETNKREEHFRALLARLEKGESPADVGKDLDQRREARRGDSDRPDQMTGGQKAPRTDRPAPKGKLTPEDREHALKFFHDNSPELAARFERLSKSDPDSVDRILNHMLPRIREAEVAKERNPGLFKLRLEEMEGGAVLVDAMRAYREAKNANPQDAAKLNQTTAQLRAALARQLDNRLSVQANEIESLTTRLSDLKTDLEKKRSARETTIDSMLAKVRDGKDAREVAPGGNPGRDGEHRPPDGAHPPANPGPPPSGR